MAGPTSKSSSDGSRTDVYGGEKGSSHSHSVFHTAADGVTTHDYERVGYDGAGQRVETVDTGAYEGNVVSGGEQYDTGWDDASAAEALSSQP